MRPIISIIIPAYNYADKLPRAIESVIPQLTPDSELIVIDDGSTDSTPDVIRILHEKHPGIFRSVRKENGGLSSVRNLGINIANGEYLVFLDADDEMEKNALTLMLEHLVCNPSSRFVIGGHRSINPEGSVKIHLPSAISKQGVERVRSYLIDKKLSLSNGACVMHRDIFHNAMYPENFKSAEDIAVFAQALGNYECSILPASLARIHKHDDSLRHQFEHASKVGLDLVDEVFAQERLPVQFQFMKKQFYIQRCLSLFRSAYISGQKCSAKMYFVKALKRDWRILFRVSYSSKAARIWLSRQ
ncbi:MAG: glycosyltransferase family 2 protein [Pseudomonas profundi]|uniref:glycosyltransferase family 2 protein n=1 Tax=Pseudomonas profundi TaxID=1981513 RepID=UPI003001DF7D